MLRAMLINVGGFDAEDAAMQDVAETEERVQADFQRRRARGEEKRAYRTVTETHWALAILLVPKIQASQKLCKTVLILHKNEGSAT